MDANRQVDVGSLLGTVASMLQQNQGDMSQMGAGGHAGQIAQAFESAAQAAKSTPTKDAGQQLQAAAQAMQQSGNGRVANYYANGLQQAASQFGGQSGLSLNDLGPLLQSISGGVQSANPAARGQGTMLDSLIPGVESFMAARSQGMNQQQAAMQALGSAVSGAMGTRQSPYAPQGGLDPGAVSSTGVLGGLFSAFLPGIMGAITGGGAAPSQQMPSQGYGQPSGGSLGSLFGALGGMMGGQGGMQQQGQPPDYSSYMQDQSRNSVD